MNNFHQIKKAKIWDRINKGRAEVWDLSIEELALIIDGDLHNITSILDEDDVMNWNMGSLTISGFDSNSNKGVKHFHITDELNLNCDERKKLAELLLNNSEILQCSTYWNFGLIVDIDDFIEYWNYDFHILNKSGIVIFEPVKQKIKDLFYAELEQLPKAQGGKIDFYVKNLPKWFMEDFEYDNSSHGMIRRIAFHEVTEWKHYNPNQPDRTKKVRDAYAKFIASKN